MKIIPLAAVPSQSLVVDLDGQDVQINIYEKFFGTFLDLYFSTSSTPIIGGCLCRNLVRVVRNTYLGFQGDLGFWDTQGSSDPFSAGYGTRFQLVYLEVADLAALGVPVVKGS